MHADIPSGLANSKATPWVHDSVEILSKGDQKPKDKAMREQVLVGVEHSAWSALRQARETEGRATNPGKWVLVELIWNGTTAREERHRTRRASPLAHRDDLHDAMFPQINQNSNKSPDHEVQALISKQHQRGGACSAPSLQLQQESVSWRPSHGCAPGSYTSLQPRVLSYPVSIQLQVMPILP